MLKATYAVSKPKEVMIDLTIHASVAQLDILANRLHESQGKHWNADMSELISLLRRAVCNGHVALVETGGDDDDILL